MAERQFRCFVQVRVQDDPDWLAAHYTGITAVDQLFAKDYSAPSAVVLKSYALFLAKVSQGKLEPEGHNTQVTLNRKLWDLFTAYWRRYRVAHRHGGYGLHHSVHRQSDARQY